MGLVHTKRALHSVTVEEAVNWLGTDRDNGLDPEEAHRRLLDVGSNELPEPEPESLSSRVTRQLREPMAILLVVAAAVDGLVLGERLDALAILAIVVINVIIALVQEGKAASALSALRELETRTASVVRDGALDVLPARELVPGDLVLLSAGDRVPADIRLVWDSSLEIDESVLTGESLPVAKRHDPPVAEEAPVAERSSMAFSGTLVARGAGRGVAVATGADSEIGRIARTLEEPEPQTPLQIQLAHLTSRLGLIAIAIATAVFVLTVARMGVSAGGVERAFLAAVALAVAAVPEGLATVVTVSLALGVRRMAEEGAIVRRLPAVETLGGTTVILSDKTGTLTENRMQLAVVATADGGSVGPDDLPATLESQVAEVAVCCNDASLKPETGDPLDVALLSAWGAARTGELRSAFPREAVLPFDSTRKRMTSLHQEGDRWALFAKGAPEVVLSLCERGLDSFGRMVALDASTRQRLAKETDRLAEAGIRVLALARRRLENRPTELDRVETQMTLVALLGLRDPVRPEAQMAVEQTVSAGIRLVMVTGDHAGTARSVAQEVGLIREGARAVTGTDLARDGVPSELLSTRVYARVDPDQKLALVEALRASGEVVAVTGDGVNDAPALRRADIGVAMGRTGSDVAREAADVVVTDDNLATIVTAVKEGRGIFRGIRAVVDYLVAGNMSEILVVIGGLVLFPALGVPLFPLQLLWINLLTDGLPAIALGVEPPDEGLMSLRPRHLSEPLLSGARIRLLLGRGALIAVAALSGLALARFAWNEPWGVARSVMFTVLVTAHLLYAFVVRSPEGGTRARLSRLATNRWLIVAVGLGLALQVLVVAIAGLRPVFGTAGLSGGEWALTLGLGVLPVALMFLGVFAGKDEETFRY